MRIMWYLIFFAFSATSLACIETEERIEIPLNAEDTLVIEAGKCITNDAELSELVKEAIDNDLLIINNEIENEDQPGIVKRTLRRLNPKNLLNLPIKRNFLEKARNSVANSKKYFKKWIPSKDEIRVARVSLISHALGFSVGLGFGLFTGTIPLTVAGITIAAGLTAVLHGILYQQFKMVRLQTNVLFKPHFTAPTISQLLRDIPREWKEKKFKAIFNRSNWESVFNEMYSFLKASVYFTFTTAIFFHALGVMDVTSVAALWKVFTAVFIFQGFAFPINKAIIETYTNFMFADTPESKSMRRKYEGLLRAGKFDEATKLVNAEIGDRGSRTFSRVMSTMTVFFTLTFALQEFPLGDVVSKALLWTGAVFAGIYWLALRQKWRAPITKWGLRFVDFYQDKMASPVLKFLHLAQEEVNVSPECQLLFFAPAAN